MERLEDLYGIGPVLAKKIEAEGVGGMKIDLKKPIRPQLKKVIQYLPLMTQADLIFHPTRRILRHHIAEIEHALDGVLVTKHDIAGSYRRGKSVSTDIDLIIKHKPFTPESAAALVEKINGSKNKVFKIVHVFSQGTDKMGVIIQKGTEHYKMDIFAATQNYPFMLLFGTGSGQFNIRMRAVAKKRGYLLNQHGLFLKNGTRVPIKNEKDLFRVLEMTYKEPSERMR